MYKARNVSIYDRIIAPVSYITAGWAGLIYFVILYFRKKTSSHFLRFNVFQSIIVAVIYFLFYHVLELILMLLSKIPIIQILVSWFQFLFMRELFFHYSLIQVLLNGFVIYLVVLSALGYYPRIYKLSDVIDKNAR